MCNSVFMLLEEQHKVCFKCFIISLKTIYGKQTLVSIHRVILQAKAIAIIMKIKTDIAYYRL